MMVKNICLIFNYLLPLMFNNRSGIKLDFICWLFWGKKKLISRIGWDLLRIVLRISLYRLIGRSGLMKMMRKIRRKRVWGLLIPLKWRLSKVILEWINMQTTNNPINSNNPNNNPQPNSHVLHPNPKHKPKTSPKLPPRRNKTDT